MRASRTPPPRRLEALRHSRSHRRRRWRRGIGPAILQTITELVQTGRAELLEELRREVPPGLVEMLQLSGLGKPRCSAIHPTLRIDTLADWSGGWHGRLAALPLFGERNRAECRQGHRLPPAGRASRG
ncbi:MAG: hypothetical protein IPO52_14235 [Gemmatimonadetes bacterium]|nr:hypothetical protein [Gemmatimonadota bacterium]